ncbi:Calcineurin-like_phosphoesterase [Hexamita inflata]|uniref:Calcineurin-like_phosphoesterase n=1 Tax=Hexamita inflata TaxID=28002 RepID=A0ABP1HG77_9EUKA
MLKVTTISDIHGKHEKLDQYLPGGDVLFCTGDITARNKQSLDDIYEVLLWMNKQNYKRIVFIAGNHDYFFQHNKLQTRQLLTRFKKITYSTYCIVHTVS